MNSQLSFYYFKCKSEVKSNKNEYFMCLLINNIFTSTKVNDIFEIIIIIIICTHLAKQQDLHSADLLLEVKFKNVERQNSYLKKKKNTESLQSQHLCVLGLTGAVSIQSTGTTL